MAKSDVRLKINSDLHATLRKIAKEYDETTNRIIAQMLRCFVDSEEMMGRYYDRAMHYSDAITKTKHREADKEASARKVPKNIPKDVPASGLYIDEDGMMRDVNIIDEDEVDALSTPSPAATTESVSDPRYLLLRGGTYTLFGGEFMYDPETKQLTCNTGDFEGQSMTIDTLQDALEMLENVGYSADTLSP